VKTNWSRAIDAKTLVVFDHPLNAMSPMRGNIFQCHACNRGAKDAPIVTNMRFLFQSKTFFF
jgi:hypothetical protein